MLSLLHSLAQSTYSYGSTTSAAGAGISAGLVILYIALIVVAIVAMWKLFVKAGRPGWAAIVPLYNAWVLAEIAGRPGWFGLVASVVAAIPVVGWIVAVIMFLLISIDLAAKFGKSTVFGVVALFLFSIVGYLILGFGSATYDASRPTNTPQIGGTSGSSGNTPASTGPKTV